MTTPTSAPSAGGPVLIVGMNGSGTTMLLDCLGRHPQLYAFPRETRIMPFILKQAARFNQLQTAADRQALAQWILQQPVFALVAEQEGVTLTQDWQACAPTAAAVLDRVLDCFAQAQGKGRWSEKSPQNLQHLEALAAAFPDARFVHVIRDGRDSAASFHRRWLRSPSLSIFRWKMVLRGGRASGKILGPQRYLEVRYETLTNAPQAGLEEICAYLGLPFDPVVLQSSRPYLEDTDEDNDESGLERNSGNWQTHFSRRQLCRLEQIAGAALREFGYEPQLRSGDRNLSKNTRKLLSLRDDLLQFGREIYLKLSGRIERPWSFILSKPFTALRQRRENTY